MPITAQRAACLDEELGLRSECDPPSLKQVDWLWTVWGSSPKKLGIQFSLDYFFSFALLYFVLLDFIVIIKVQLLHKAVFVSAV